MSIMDDMFSVDSLSKEHDENKNEESIKKYSPFDFLNSLYNKTYILNNPDEEKAFASSIFLIEKGLSMNINTIFICNEMNERYNLPSKMIYDYFFYSIRKKSYRNDWKKKLTGKDEDIDNISNIFGYSKKESKKYLNLLNDNIKKDMKKIIKNS